MDVIRKTQLLLFGDSSEGDIATKPKATRNRRKKQPQLFRFLFDLEEAPAPTPPKKRGRKPKERPPKIRKRDYKPLEESLYNMMAGDVSEEDDKRIQEILEKRKAEVRATWSANHERKANNFPVEPIILAPIYRSDNY